MDSITHILLGAAIGEVVLGNKIGRKAMFWGAIANTIPDFDVFASPCCSHAQQLMIHRGITHSLFFAITFSPILAWLFRKIYSGSGVSFKAWFWLFFLNLLSHILVDALTCYGTGWFEPFSSFRVAFNTIFVADPFYTIPLLICVLFALSLKDQARKKMIWAYAGLIISSAYLIFTIWNKFQITDTMKESLTEQKIVTSDFKTTPTPLNNFLWMAYAADTSGYWFGYYSVFDKTKKVDYFHVNKNNFILVPYADDPDVKILQQFSQGYYCITKDKENVYFNDIRFGQIGGWDEPTDAFVFSFKLQKGADNSMALDRMKFKGSYSDALASLINRVKGK